MSQFDAVDDDVKGKYSVEWFDNDRHVLDLCGLSASDISVLEKFHVLYDGASEVQKGEVRGVLYLLEDGLTNGYIKESAEVLLRMYDHFAAKFASELGTRGRVRKITNERKTDVIDVMDLMRLTRSINLLPKDGVKLNEREAFMVENLKEVRTDKDLVKLAEKFAATFPVTQDLWSVLRYMLRATVEKLVGLRY